MEFRNNLKKSFVLFFAFMLFISFAFAELQKTADEWYYVRNNQDHSSWLLDQIIPLKEMINKMGIGNKVYIEAYKIYDFRNSGKKEYILKDGKIQENDFYNEYNKSVLMKSIESLKKGR